MNIAITKGPPHPWPEMSERDAEILECCVKSGHVWVGWVDGQVEAVWGVIPPSFLSEEAYLWMWDLPIKHPRVLARYSRKVISALLDQWPALKGHCQCDALQSQRWLHWLGAEFTSSGPTLTSFEIRRA